MAAEQRRLRQQYEARLAELEAERQGAEADLAQVGLESLCAEFQGPLGFALLAGFALQAARM